MANARPHTEVKQGEMVTTHNTFGGIGIGYLMDDGEVYKTTGSYWAVNAKNDVFPMISYNRDGGKEYMATARRITGWAI